MARETEGELVGDDVDDYAIWTHLCGCGFGGYRVRDKRCQAYGQGLLVLVMVEAECENSVGCTNVEAHLC